MKIYFEDGDLRNSTQLPVKVDFIIKANRGVSRNIDDLDLYARCKPDAVIYTNSIFAFSNKYAWNNDLKVPEVYIRAGEHMIFTRIDKLTDKEIREGHNIGKMYINGAFDNLRFGCTT